MNFYEFFCKGAVHESKHTWPLLFLDCKPRADSQQDTKIWLSNGICNLCLNIVSQLYLLCFR